MSFENPLALWLLVALPVACLLAWRNRAAVARRRLVTATVLRCAVLALVSLALARPLLLERSTEVSVVYALDISRSVSPAFVREALDWIGATNARYAPAQARFVVFGDHARMLDTREQVLAVPLAGEAGPSQADAIDQSATDLEQALNTAVFGFAPQSARRLVLVSDGNQTQGDVWRALPRLQAEGIRVYTVPAAVSVDSDAWVDSIAVPEGVREQEPVTVSMRVFSRTQARARIQLTSGDRILAARTLELQPGENEIALPVRFPRTGSHR